MSDFENEDDIFKKMQAEDDDIKPIDIGADTAARRSQSPGSPPFPESDLINPAEEFRQEMPEELASHVFDSGINFIKRGEYVDILRKDPTLKVLRIGGGWEQRAMEEDKVDIDLSVFFLDRNEKTREDSDFVFYNNQSGFDGGCKHSGDSRNGAGEGDDETVILDLNALPFDIQKVVFIFSIYDEEMKGLNFSLVRDVFLRIVNEDSGEEVCRFAFEDSELIGGNGIYVASLIREGPRWTFEATGQFVNGGLGEIATQYGIVVQELQSSG